MSKKTVSSNIIPIVNQNRNRLYDKFEMTVAFSSFFSQSFPINTCFKTVLKLFQPVLNSLACASMVWGMVYNCSNNFVVIFQKYSKTWIYKISYNSALMFTK